MKSPGWLLRDLSRRAGKATRQRRSTQLEVIDLEPRALMSAGGALELTRGSLEPVHHRIAESKSARVPSARKNQSAPPPITPIDRLGYYDPTLNGGEYESLSTALATNPNLLKGKTVYVLAHGWAPGFSDLVAAYDKKYDVASNTTMPRVLQWWQTIPSNYSKESDYRAILDLVPPKERPKEPESAWLLDGYTAAESGIVVSSKGMTQNLIATSPNPANTVVLAYSWLDGSATSSAKVDLPIIGKFDIPLDAYLSEARTTMYGETLAMGLEQVLGTPESFGGNLQLIGHSHGSKVATVAAVALSHFEVNSKADPFTVNQLTLLDSPESDAGTGGAIGLALAEIGAANDNWVFLQNLNISKTPSPTSTFVDTYFSALGEPYSEISYTGANGQLANVVDSNLYDQTELLHPELWHSYAAEWYAGSAEGPNTSTGDLGGRKWSPLYKGNGGAGVPPQSLTSHYYTQSILWRYYGTQFNLQPAVFTGNNNPAFSTVTLTTKSKTPGATEKNNLLTGASVTLTRKNNKDQQYVGHFKTAQDYSAGLTFNYKFTKYAPGDLLEISDFNTLEQKYQLAFVMDPTLVPAQTDALQGTISLGAIGKTGYDLKFTLVNPTASATSSSSVTVSNLMQYANPSTKPSTKLRSQSRVKA